MSGAPTPAAALAGARRLVVKIGSALLVDDGGLLRQAWLNALVDDIVRCRARGRRSSSSRRARSRSEGGIWG